MGIWNDRKLIVNCLPLTESERAQFTRAAKDMPQEFVGVEDTFTESGDYEKLLVKYGLSAANIVAKAEKVLRRKR